MKKQYNLWQQLALVFILFACLLTGWHYNDLFAFQINHLEYGSDTFLMGSVSGFLSLLGGFVTIRLLFPNASIEMSERSSSRVGGWLLLMFTLLMVLIKLLMGRLGVQIVPFPIFRPGRLDLVESILYSNTPALLLGVTLGWLFRGLRGREV